MTVGVKRRVKCPTVIINSTLPIIVFSTLSSLSLSVYILLVVVKYYTKYSSNVNPALFSETVG